MSSTQPSVSRTCIAEFLGTFILIFFGCGAVHASVAFGAQQGLWQVAIVWGVAIMLAVYAIGSISGAHINPAITIAMAAWRGFPKTLVLPYIASQVLGAFLAAACLFFLFSGELSEVERAKGVVRGKPGSEITASCYGEFYPAPGAAVDASGAYSAQKHTEIKARVPHHVAFFAEVLGTMILALVVFAYTDEKNTGTPPAGMAPVFIGLTVSCLISVLAPLTQACFNPARDFGPRIFSALAGWGSVAFPGADGWGWLTVYIIAPIAGALLGGAIYTFVVQPLYLPQTKTTKR